VVFITLDAYLKGRSVDDLDPDEAQRWIASLITSKRKARTVKDTWASASRTVFAWAVGQKLIKTNPFADVAKTIRVPRQVKNREDDKAFSPAEQQTILKAALAVKDISTPVKAAYRWAPWLCAYSGARAGEITQLRGQDIEQRSFAGSGGHYWVMKLTPDAGTIKGLQARTVPIHEHVIEQGFLDFVKSRGRGPLFYRPDTKKHSGAGSSASAEDPLRPRRPRAVKTLDKLAEWVRKLGVTDTEIQPNHAWRHTFKQKAARVKIEKVVRDAICGHAAQSEGDAYEKPLVEDMAKALKLFPRYEIS
jgi:integrase